MTVSEVTVYVMENWESISTAVLAVIGAAAAVAALTPTPKDDSFLAVLRKFIDVVGMNFGNAKNAK